MNLRLVTSRTLCSLGAALAAGTTLAACGGSSSSGRTTGGGSSSTGNSPITGAVPSGDQTVNETLGSHSFAVAVPSGWKASKAETGSDGTHVVVLSANGAAIGGTTLGANSALVLVAWNPKTSVTVAKQLSETEADDSTLTNYKHTIATVSLSGASQAKLLSETYTNNKKPATASAVVAKTTAGGLIEIEAVSAQTSENSFVPSATVDSLKIK